MDSEDVVHIHKAILLSNKKNNNKKVMPFTATWTQLEILIPGEVQKENDKYHVISLIRGI